MHSTLRVRRLLGVAVTASLIVAACGSDGSPPQDNATDVPAEEPMTTEPEPGESDAAPDAPATTTGEVSESIETGDSDAAEAVVNIVDDFENYDAGNLPEQWVTYGSANGRIGDTGSSIGMRDGSDGDTVLIWDFDANADPGFGGLRHEFAEAVDWTGQSGLQFWYFGSGEGGEIQVEIGEDRTTDVERYRTRSFFDREAGWSLIRLPFESFAPARFNPEPGNGILDLVAVEQVVIAANSGKSGSDVAIDDLGVYFDGTTMPVVEVAPPPAVEVVEIIEDFEAYEGSATVPESWFNYGNAGGGVSLIGPDDRFAQESQAEQNKALAWGFDAISDPGYGGVGKEFTEPVDWTNYTGLQFWFYGSGEGGELQIEIGEDKTSDVERYRAPAFYDREIGWQLITLPFESFSPSDWNPVPGNGILDLRAVYNIVFAANSGESVEGVVIDDVAVYNDGTTAISDSASTSNAAVSTVDYNALPLLPAPDPIPVDPPNGMELVWSDEFDGDEINPDNWRFDQGGWGWGNGESQFYTDRPQNARVVDGMLVIEAWEEEYLGSYYTSARLLSQGLQEFQYGRIEARLNVPAGQGTWPAFWMLGSDFEHFAEDPTRRWPNVGEIDIMEYVGREPDLVIGTLHGPGYAGAGAKSRWFRQDFDVADDWHTYAIDWDETGIRWFFDGEQYAEVGPENIKRGEWVFDQPFFMLINLAIGGTLGGYLDPDLEFPLRYYADYVRVYQ